MKRLLVVVALVVTAAGALSLRVVLAGRAALAEGDAARSEGRTLDAIAAWEAAARWYLPGAPHVDEAYARLTALAVSSTRTPALAAWRAVRSAARATRSLWTPHADDLAAADLAIAKLSADDPEGSLEAGRDHAARQAWQAEQLARDARPRPLAALLAGLGLVLWLAGVARLARRGVDGEGRLVRRAAARAAGLAVVGLGVWALGLYAV